MIQDPFRSMIRSEGSCDIATFRGAARAIRTSFGFPRSCCSKHRCHAWRRVCRRGSIAFRPCRRLPKPRLPMFWTLGRAWATTDALWRSTRPLSALWRTGTVSFRVRRVTWSLCLVLARQRRKVSGRLRLTFQACIWRPTCARSFCITSFPMYRLFPTASWCR